MTRKLPTGGGRPPRGRSGHGRRVAGAGGGKNKKRLRAARSTVPTQMSASVQRATNGGAGRVAAGPWGAVKAAASPQPLIALSTAQEATPLLTLAGAQSGQGTAEWGDASDAAANRAWRRPGGLTRPAGL